MNIWRDQPLADDHPEGPASCKWSSVTPCTQVTSARIQIQSRGRILNNLFLLLYYGLGLRYFSVTILCVTRRSMHGKGRWSSRLRRRRAPSRGCTPEWTWAKSVISSTSGWSSSPLASLQVLLPLVSHLVCSEKRKWQNWIQVFLLFNQLRGKTLTNNIIIT